MSSMSSETKKKKKKKDGLGVDRVDQRMGLRFPCVSLSEIHGVSFTEYTSSSSTQSPHLHLRVTVTRVCITSGISQLSSFFFITYFVGNAPMAHMAIQPTEETPDLPSYKRFFFKCSVVAASKYNISNCEDFVWVTKDELLEFFPEQAEFFNKMIIS